MEYDHNYHNDYPPFTSEYSLPRDDEIHAYHHAHYTVWYNGQLLGKLSNSPGTPAYREIEQQKSLDKKT